MIFSFGKNSSKISLSRYENLDLLCFFHVEGGVIAPPETWFDVMCASLKNKRTVLILEESIDKLPSLEGHLRWQVTEDWICLQPRALSAITVAYPKHSQNTVQFRQFLSSI